MFYLKRKPQNMPDIPGSWQIIHSGTEKQCISEFVRIAFNNINAIHQNNGNNLRNALIQILQNANCNFFNFDYRVVEIHNNPIQMMVGFPFL